MSKVMIIGGGAAGMMAAIAAAYNGNNVTLFEKNEKFKLILKRITRTKEEIIRVKNTVGQKFNNLWVNKFNFSTLSTSPTLYFFWESVHKNPVIKKNKTTPTIPNCISIPLYKKDSSFHKLCWVCGIIGRE